jgi:hypothetical protein
MDKLELKKKLLETCVTMQQKRLDMVQHEINDAQLSANEYGQPKDRYDSFRMQLLRKKDMLGQQLQTVNAEFIGLKKINTATMMDKVSFGAVVVTNDQKLFISISLGRFELGKETYFAISPNVPLYEAMKGLSKGEEFTFMGKRRKIVDVF